MTAAVSQRRTAARLGRPTRIGVVGGGASGLLTAAALLREAPSPVAVTIFEPRPELGQGIAYSTRDRLHLLNVPAGGMSALPDDPDHFQRWAGNASDDFVARTDYARYLRDVLHDALRDSVPGCAVEHRREVVSNLGVVPAPWVVSCSGSFGEFDALVLATGHGSPQVPAAIADGALPDGRLVTDPWSAGALDVVQADESVLVVGTGLTFVDVSLSLMSQVKGVRVEAVSRHGLTPCAHEDPWRPRHPAPDWDPSSVDLHTIMAYLRGFGGDWRRGLDSLRPLTAAIWQALDAADRDRVARHLGRFWDVHRHRMAPSIARGLSTVLDAGRVRISSGSVVSVRMVDGRVAVALDDGRRLVVDRVVMCTGPSGDPTATSLGRLLIGRGLAEPGPMGVGYLVDDTGALVTADGASEVIFTVGPPRRGVLWESTAIPEIREQAVGLARHLVQRQRVAA